MEIKEFKGRVVQITASGKSFRIEDNDQLISSGQEIREIFEVGDVISFSASKDKETGEYKWLIVSSVNIVEKESQKVREEREERVKTVLRTRLAQNLNVALEITGSVNQKFTSEDVTSIALALTSWENRFLNI